LQADLVLMFANALCFNFLNDKVVKLTNTIFAFTVQTVSRTAARCWCL
jgi:hypothetical protein